MPAAAPIGIAAEMRSISARVSRTSSAPTGATASPPTSIGAEVAVWCSNDYLGIGQHLAVLAAVERARRTMGASAAGPPKSGDSYCSCFGRLIPSRPYGSSQ